MPTIAEQLAKLLKIDIKPDPSKNPEKSCVDKKSKLKSDMKNKKPGEKEILEKTKKRKARRKIPHKVTKTKRQEKASKGSPSIKSKGKKPSYTAQEIKEISSQKRIGLGIDSISKIEKIRKEDVVIDKHTTPLKESLRHHALYVAGWSLKDDS